MAPQLTVFMPSYNRAATYLQAAIDSVLKQSFGDFELLIVDDGSTDNTREVVAGYTDKRIVFHPMEKNYGEYWVTNYGIAHARGQYLTWVHTDDLLPPGSLKLRMEELVNNPDLDFVHGDINRIDENGNTVEYLPAVEWDSEKLVKEYVKLPEEREIRYMVHHSTVMMRWNFFYKAGPFDASLPYAGDIDWLIRAIRIGRYKRIPQVLYHYRTHSGTRRIQDIKHGVNKNDIIMLINRRYI